MSRFKRLRQRIKLYARSRVLLDRIHRDAVFKDKTASYLHGYYAAKNGFDYNTMVPDWVKLPHNRWVCKYRLGWKDGKAQRPINTEVINMSDSEYNKSYKQT